MVFLRRKDSRDGTGSVSSFSTLTTKFSSKKSNLKGDNSSNNNDATIVNLITSVSSAGGGGGSEAGGGGSTKATISKRPSFLMCMKRNNTSNKDADGDGSIPPSSSPAAAGTASPTSSSSSLPSLLSPEDQQVLLDYMVQRLPSLDPILNSKLMNNPCGAGDSSLSYANHTTNLCTSVYDSLNDTFKTSGSGNKAKRTMRMNSTNSSSSSSSSSDLLESSNDYDTSADIDGVCSMSAEEPTGFGLRFGTVQVREYNRTVGDHPDVSDDGPPLTIDWTFVQKHRVTLNQYEAKKHKRRQRRIDRRNAKLRLENRRISYDQLRQQKNPNLEFSVPRIRGQIRREILHLDFDVPFQDLVQAELEVKKIQQQREESNAQSLLAEKTEEILQSAQRKIKRSFTFGRNSIADRGGYYNYALDENNYYKNNDVYEVPEYQDRYSTGNYHDYYGHGANPRHYRHHYNHNQQQQSQQQSLVTLSPKLIRRSNNNSKAFSPPESHGHNASSLSSSGPWGEQRHHSQAYKNCYAGI